jgi:hypothetical protein
VFLGNRRAFFEGGTGDRDLHGVFSLRIAGRRRIGLLRGVGLFLASLATEQSRQQKEHESEPPWKKRFANWHVFLPFGLRKTR